MSDLQKHIKKRKKSDEDFAENFEKGFKDFKTEKTFSESIRRSDWEKAREILAKAPDIEAEDYDKL